MRSLTKELVTQVAYLIGIRNDQLESRYSDECAQTLQEISSNDDARVIRVLCTIRSTMMQKYELVNSRLRYDLKNIDSMEFFNSEDIKWLEKQGIRLIQVNTTADNYIIKINQLIHDNIGKCKPLFPEWVNWSYVQDLFVIPGCLTGNLDKAVKALWAERNTYMHNIPLYPFQLYIHWTPTDCGNFLSTDRKFLTVLYRNHGDEFYDNSKVMDANDDTKDSLYDFIDDSESVAIVVDCENSDVYKLYSVLHNLDSEKLSKIKKIILYDDYHTTNVWKLLEKLIKIKVEYIDVERVTDAKSLVDICMTAGVCREFYNDNVNSFILVSSDSDFWGLISSLPDADFLVMIEYDKCGERIKRVLRENEIYYCSIDDFCRGNIDHIKSLALRTELNERLKDFNETGIWKIINKEEFINDIFRACRIEITPIEKRRFVEKYIDRLQFKADKHGRFCITVKE